jgi:hypothetical protein
LNGQPGQDAVKHGTDEEKANSGLFNGTGKVTRKDCEMVVLV